MQFYFALDTEKRGDSITSEGKRGLDTGKQAKLNNMWNKIVYTVDLVKSQCFLLYNLKTDVKFKLLETQHIIENDIFISVKYVVDAQFCGKYLWRICYIIDWLSKVCTC